MTRSCSASLTRVWYVTPVCHGSKQTMLMPLRSQWKNVCVFVSTCSPSLKQRLCSTIRWHWGVSPSKSGSGRATPLRYARLSRYHHHTELWSLYFLLHHCFRVTLFPVFVRSTSCVYVYWRTTLWSWWSAPCWTSCLSCLHRSGRRSLPHKWTDAGFPGGVSAQRFMSEERIVTLFC